jgi:hypothetical protein
MRARLFRPHFEEQMRKLGLNETTCADSQVLRHWCESHKNLCFIPEWLLKQWGMKADADLCG